MGESNTFIYISIISFALLIISGILSYVNFQKWDAKIFWNLFASVTGVPISVHEVVLYILFSILLLFALISFIIIIIYRNEEGLREGILGKYSKFHFIPILCATSLYIIGEAYGVNNLINDAPYAFSIIFSIIGLCSLIFIYIQTSMPKLNARLAIKKGLYSSLIVLFVYNLCFTITLLGQMKISSLSGLRNWRKGTSIAFSLIIGIINLVLSFILKDVIIPGMNLIIYLAMTIDFFRSGYRLNGVAEGVIDIIIGVFSICMICVLSIKYKTNILN